jgi:hypothetical protein
LLCLVAAPAGAIDWEKIVVNGYTSFEFERMLAPKGEGAGDPNGSFDADEFDLVLNFNASDKIRATTDLTWEHGAATEDNRGNIAMEYGFVEYTITDLAKIRVGKMFTPFGLFNQIHTAKPAFLSVKEPASTNKPERIVTDAQRFFPRWGAGIAVQGDGTVSGRQFDYDVLLANGEQDGTNPYEEDNNKSKSLTGRFRFEPTENLKLGASMYYDNSSNGGTSRVRSHGVELEWSPRQWHVLAEAIVGRAESGNLGSKDQTGWFVQPAYHFDNGVTPYLRFDWIDPDTDKASDEGYDVVLGVNYELSKWFMIKLENNYFKGAKNSSLAAYPGRDYNEIKAAVVLGF